MFYGYFIIFVTLVRCSNTNLMYNNKSILNQNGFQLGLLQAVQEGKVLAVKRALKKESVNQYGTRNLTALHWSMLLLDSKKRKEIVELLLAAGANQHISSFNYLIPISLLLNRPYLTTADIEIMNLLLTTFNLEQCSKEAIRALDDQLDIKEKELLVKDPGILHDLRNKISQILSQT